MVVARVSRLLSVPLALALVLLLLVGVAPMPVRAASHAVTVTLNDGNSGGNSDLFHTCTTNCAFTGQPGALGCSLRDAVVFSNSQVAADTTTITLPAGTYTLRIVGVDDVGFLGDLNLDRNVTINGAGAGTTIVQASATGSATGGLIGFSRWAAGGRWGRRRSAG